MDVKKNDIRTLIVLGIVWVAYSVVVVALPFPMNAVFWLSYIFTTLAIAVQIYVLYSAFRKGDELTEAANRRMMHVTWSSLAAAILGGLAAVAHVSAIAAVWNTIPLGQSRKFRR